MHFPSVAHLHIPFLRANALPIWDRTMKFFSNFFEIGHPINYFFVFFWKSDKVLCVWPASRICISPFYAPILFQSEIGQWNFFNIFEIGHPINFIFFNLCEIGQCFMRFPSVAHSNIAFLCANSPPIWDRTMKFFSIFFEIGHPINYLWSPISRKLKKNWEKRPWLGN